MAAKRRTRTRTRTRTKQPRPARVARPARRSVGKRSQKKSRKGKRPLNPFFKVMLKAKGNKDESFVYNGVTYKGVKHPKLEMIYKRA